MTDRQRKELEKEANRIQEAVKHASQAQFEQVKIWQRTHKWIGVPAVVLAAIAGVGGASKAIGTLAAGVTALVAASLTALQTFLELPKKIESASSAGNAYLALQQDSRIFENIDTAALSYEEARTQLAEIVKRQQDTNGIAPVPSKKARERARKNIEDGSQDYEADK